MYYHLKNKHGNIEAVIDDNCGISKFYTVAAMLFAELNVDFLKREKNTESLLWEFRYKNQVLTLHYNVFNGVSLFPKHLESVLQENNMVLEIAHYLERRAC